MSAGCVSHKHRHFKTLILLVVSMTAGTIFLFWVGNLSPVTPLRSSARNSASWTDITVRPVHVGQVSGAFHLRIDEQGRTFQMTNWDRASEAASARGTIHIVLNLPLESEPGVSAAQRSALARLLADLSRRFSIADQRIRLDPTPRLARSDLRLAQQG